MHVGLHVVDALDPFETDIGEILTHKGARMGYTYDLGDQFEHVITCTEILGADDSTGACTVLGGLMRCPNEDGKGNSCYQEEVLDMLECRGALTEACRERARALNCENGKFDPYEFSVQACQKALNEALGSKASAGMGGGSGAKKFVHKFFPGDFTGKGTVFGDTAPGQKRAVATHLYQDDFPAHMGHMQENINTRPDKPEERLCGNCGSPNDLSACAKCKSAFYCSKDCQREAWRHHKLLCKSQAIDRAEYKQEKKQLKRAPNP